MYSKQQKEAALKLYKQSESVAETVRILGYPTRKQLYNWIYEERHPPKERKKLAEVGNPKDHPRNPPLEVKLNAIQLAFKYSIKGKILNHMI
jgi:putative transposase